MVRYLLIDDDTAGAADASLYARKLTRSSGGKLEVIAVKPLILAEMLESLRTEKPDGLLLDVALTNAQAGDGAPLGYDGIALAQQVRTLQTRGRTRGDTGLGEFPVVRFSKEGVIHEYVNTDSTSNDLFDEMIDKSELVGDLKQSEDVARRLVSLASDYPKVVSPPEGETADTAVATILGVSVEFLARLDPRSLLGLRRPDLPAHILARYFTAKLLAHPGLLMRESLLAVRLGVDIKRSDDWPAVVEKIQGTRYRGVFGEGYCRWWTVQVADWWQEVSGDERALQKLTTDERVAILSEKLGLTRLAALPEDRDSPGRRFWHQCVLSGRPVDPAFGFALMAEYGFEIWQDAEYLCQEEALRGVDHPRLSASDRNRLMSLRTRGRDGA